MEVKIQIDNNTLVLIEDGCYVHTLSNDEDILTLWDDLPQYMLVRVELMLRYARTVTPDYLRSDNHEPQKSWNCDRVDTQ